MWNNLKMDLYRMVRQKSFYISMTVMLLLYLWLTTAVGLQNNTPFATFHQGKDTLVDFLYYFPKSSFYQIAVLIFLSLFFCEEYASGFVKNIYPMMHRKELLLLERFVFSFITAFIYWAVIIVMVVVENLWQQDSFASFSILQFICILSEYAHSCDRKQSACYSGVCRLWQYDGIYAACRDYVITEGGVYRLYSVCDIRSAAVFLGRCILQPGCYGGNYQCNPV